MSEDLRVQVPDPRNPGKWLKGWVHRIPDGSMFEEAAVVFDPHNQSTRYKSFDEMTDEATEWQELADKGAVYSDDITEGRPAYRQAVADWWRKARTVAESGDEG